MKPTSLYCTLMLTGCLLLSMPPATQGFMALEHERGQPVDTMIDKVHAQHWDIAYRYGDECPPEERNNDKALTAAVTEALQMWLQPLRDYAKRPIVADFRYLLDAGLHAGDLSITFHCKRGQSGAAVSRGGRPHISMRNGVQVTPAFMSVLVHEMGHTFGLADTYLRGVDWGKPELDKGGPDSTKGTQPSSIMAGASGFHRDGGMLGRDDKVGIVWLYKRRYEGLGLRDCFFPDYELEKEPLGCRPQYPLIFALKHGAEVQAIIVLRDDEGLDVNVRDADGMTALHHAVLNKYTRVVTALLQRADLRYYKNNDGQTPLQLATAFGFNEIAALIAAHPKALSVTAKGKRPLTTTWAALKTVK